MLDAVKLYATRIVVLHLALLVLVIAFVLGAARQVQLSARDEAQLQSKERLLLLADQTARGLEAHYESIEYDLRVMLSDEANGTTQSATAPATTSATTEAGTLRGLFGRGRGGATGGGRGGRGRQPAPLPRVNPGPVTANPENLNLIWRQLQARADQLFLVDLATLQVRVAYPNNTEDIARRLTRQNLEWLRGLKGPEMSAFHLTEPSSTGDRAGYHLIAVPALWGGQGGGGQGGGGPGFGGPGGGGGGGPGGGGPGGGFGGGPQGAFGGPGGPGGFNPGGPNGGGPGDLPPERELSTTQPAQFAVVVVVPIDKIRDQFFKFLDSDTSHDTGAVLVNDQGETLLVGDEEPEGNVAPWPGIGTQLLKQLDPDTAASLDPLITDPSRATDAVVLEKPFTIGKAQSVPQIVASAKLSLPSNHHWTVLISSPLTEAETIVNRVFGASVKWAIFVCAAVTGLLLSTSIFLIRARVGLERTRHEILTRELEQARHIQLAWLPDMKSAPAGLDVSATNLPANHISGDFYNWFKLPPAQGAAPGTASEKIAIVIGDVTGHGMAAAFLMATTQLLVRMTLTRYQDPARCLREVNKQLCVQGFQGQFVTMLVMVLDLSDNTVEIATAGHPTPLIECSDGNGAAATLSGRHFHSLELEPQLVLGVDPDEEYRAQSFILEPGSSVLLYTDGVVEAESEDGKQFGVENLIHTMEKQTDLDPAARIRAILADVKRFRGSRELLDDVTLVAIRTAPVTANVTR